eukprot:TRINITY_DN1016_c0_g1_i1.p1 TRINITY_DN1016_c0_g1~~TRINITY_DN1016_c0_g1_i1.p1  ORF type:complete len:408 (-),score=61.87 TRINITY_DN1016_c0_g1_i1:382-1605(-)
MAIPLPHLATLRLTRLYRQPNPSATTASTTTTTHTTTHTTRSTCNSSLLLHSSPSLTPPCATSTGPSCTHTPNLQFSFSNSVHERSSPPTLSPILTLPHTHTPNRSGTRPFSSLHPHLPSVPHSHPVGTPHTRSRHCRFSENSLSSPYPSSSSLSLTSSPLHRHCVSTQMESFNPLSPFRSFSMSAFPRNQRKLVEHLKDKADIQSQRVEQAMLGVDRGYYVPDSNTAYIDSPCPIGFRQTISAPHIHAAALELLSPVLKPEAKVLEVGSGSGYLTACLAAMVAPSGKVFGIERLPKLVEQSKSNIHQSNPEFEEMVNLQVGDGWVGLPAEAPFDAIHVGAAAETMPSSLVDQLAPGGIMVIPVGPSYDQRLYEVKKDLNGNVTQRSLLPVRYVPLVRTRKASTGIE